MYVVLSMFHNLYLTWEIAYCSSVLLENLIVVCALICHSCLLKLCPHGFVRNYPLKGLHVQEQTSSKMGKCFGVSNIVLPHQSRELSDHIHTVIVSAAKPHGRRVAGSHPGV